MKTTDSESGEHIVLPKGKIVDPKELVKGTPEHKLPPEPGQTPRPGDVQHDQ